MSQSSCSPPAAGKVSRSSRRRRSGSSQGWGSPALTDALRDARLGRHDILLVYRVDRFARSLKVLVGLVEELEAVGVAFRSATEPIDTSAPTGRMLVQLLGVFAEFERATIINRVRRWYGTQSRAGGWPGGTVPYGLRLDDDHHLAIEPAEFPIVERIFTRYGNERAGAPHHRHRTEQRWAPRPHWTPLLRQGRPRHPPQPRRPRRNLFPRRAHQPEDTLIDPGLFDKAQTLLVERGESYDRGFTDKDPDYLLTGLIRCRHCHRNYVGAAARGKGHRYRYYTCWTRQRYGKDACTGERIRADVLEKAVFTALLAIYADPELLERAIAAKTRNTATAENSKTKSTTAASNSADASLKRSSKTSS